MWCLIPMAVWVVIYGAVGWVTSRDEQPLRRLTYALLWGILPTIDKFSRKLAKFLKPIKTKMDETDAEEDLRLWKEANRPSW